MRDIANATTKTKVFIDVEVEHSDGTVKSLEGRCNSLHWGSDIDRKDWWCEMEFVNHPVEHVANNLSLDPLDQNSTMNQDGSAAYKVLLSNWHDVRVKIRKDAGDPWALIFGGQALRVPGAVQMLEGGDKVSFSPVGMSQMYKAIPRLSKWVYEGRDIASLLASILGDSNFKSDRAHVVVENDPLLYVTEYTTGESTTMEVLQAAIKRTGYVLGVKYWASGTAFNDGSGLSTSAEGFFLTLFDPLRVGGTVPSTATTLIQASRTPDATLTGDYVRRIIELDIKDVRTWIEVDYMSAIKGMMQSVIVEDTDAQALYGVPAGDGTRLHRPMRIVEQANSFLDTEGEVTDFAYACLHDTSSPTPDAVIEMPYCWPNPEPHDLIRVVCDDYTIEIGVMSVEHEVSMNNWTGSTTIRGTIDKVIGERAYWIAQDLSEEERNKVRAEWLLGSMSQLGGEEGWGEAEWGAGWGNDEKTTQNLALRSMTHEADDGHFESAVAASWRPCNQWWFDHSEVWVSIGNNARYGVDPYSTTRGSHAMISPVPPGSLIFVKVRHMPINSIDVTGNIGR